jgi:colanic acid/amylovoran biosynthesis glycosyltransferase
VGRLHWKKGYEYALQAVRLLQEQGIYCDYRIIGGGDYLEGLTFARHEMGIEDQVSFLGTQTPVQVREQMRWADVFLHAATSEGFCNAVLEAQAMALPVVCSDADGLAENVVDGQTGFVVPRRDPAALAERLSVLAADAELRKRLGNSGRERVENCFQLPTQIAAFDRFYKQLVRSND